MKMNKRRFTLLIIFMLILVLSINVFASNADNYMTAPETRILNSENDFNQNQNYIQNNQNQNNQLKQENSAQNDTNVNFEKQEVEGDAILPTKQKTELLNMKDKSRTSLAKYQAKYKNNVIYGTIAYVLNLVRLAAVPIFIVGYLISIVYEFIVGMKRREMVRKGRGMRITLVSAFAMVQVLPLIFAIVIKFWGN